MTTVDQSIAIFLCREPCLHAIEDDEHEWDINGWTALIVDKTLLSGIVNIPTDVMIKRSRKIDNKDIVRLENLWKKNPKAQLEDLQNSTPNSKGTTELTDIYSKKLGLPKVCPQKEKNEPCAFCSDKPTVFCAIFYNKKTKYFTTQKYLTIYNTMVEKEAEYDKQM